MSNIITPEEVQQGDKIRVSLVETDSGDRKYTVTYEGVAAKPEAIFNGKPVWRTEQDWNLYVHEPHAVIELLDRPLPAVPTLPKAVVNYVLDGKGHRTGIRGEHGQWNAYNAEGEWVDAWYTDKAFERFFDFHKVDFDIVFGGVAK